MMRRALFFMDEGVLECLSPCLDVPRGPRARWLGGAWSRHGTSRGLMDGVHRLHSRWRVPSRVRELPVALFLPAIFSRYT
jgi:hypothetical protein